MPRPKGSKNKKSTKNVDFDAQIAVKRSAKAELEEEQATILGVLAGHQEHLKKVRKEIRSLEKEIAKLEAQKTEAEAAAASSRAEEEVRKHIAALVAGGTSLDEILEKLK